MPDRDRIEAVTKRLMLSTGCSMAAIEQTIGTVQRRSQLVGKTPESLAEQWAGVLQVPKQTIIDFFADAGYLSSY